MAMAWTEKMVEDLKIMWKQGLTTGEIGKRLGVSKNSIVGKVHRLQLDARPSPIKKKEPEEVKETKTEKKSCKSKSAEKNEVKKETKKEAKIETKAEEKVIEKAPQPLIEEVKTFTPKPITPAKTYNGNAKLTDLDNHTCRWPIGDPKDENFHFCGRKIKLGQTYCEEHAALAYVKPNNKK